MVYKIFIAILTISIFLHDKSIATEDSFKKLSRQEYIDHFSQLAIEEMNEYYDIFKEPKGKKSAKKRAENLINKLGLDQRITHKLHIKN